MSTRQLGTVTRVGRAYRMWPGLALAALACASNPRRTGLYDVGPPPHSECLPRVELLSTRQLARPYRELARLSATCPQLTPQVCEQALLDRGCALHADAVVIDSSGTVAPNVRSLPDARRRGSYALVAQEARAVRYQARGQTR